MNDFSVSYHPPSPSIRCYFSEEIQLVHRGLFWYIKMAIKYWYTKKQRNNKPIVVKISLSFVAGWPGTAIFQRVIHCMRKILQQKWSIWHCYHTIVKMRSLGDIWFHHFRKRKRKKFREESPRCKDQTTLPTMSTSLQKSHSYIFHIQLNRRYTDMFTR